MQLFMHPASPNCVAILAAAHMIGLTLDLLQVDLFGEENKRAPFLQINANGLVPVLRDDDFVLWETIAILQYIAAADPQKRLLADDERTRADTSRWMSWGLGHWNPALQPFIFERLFRPMKGLGEADESRLQELEPKLNGTAAVLEERLTRSQYLGGDRICIADVYLAAYPIYAEQARIDFIEFPNIKRWLGAIHTSEAWRNASPSVAS
jgi:glutathione S-transferase